VKSRRNRPPGERKKPGRKKRIPRKLGTIWRVPDALWARMEVLIEEFHPRAATGRPRGDLRRVIDGIIYQLRTGCQWNQLPKEFGSDTTVHRWFTAWVESGMLEALWARLASECDELGEVYFRWLAADGQLGKSRMGGGKTGPNPTDRGKAGTKKSVLVDQEGGPLSVVLAGANVNDHKLLDETLSKIVIDRPDGSSSHEQNLCLDRGYDNEQSRESAEDHGFEPHIRPIHEEKKAS
jgi:putative transposase